MRWQAGAEKGHRVLLEALAELLTGGVDALCHSSGMDRAEGTSSGTRLSLASPTMSSFMALLAKTKYKNTTSNTRN